MFFMPPIFNAARCSAVCGCGHFSLAATRSRAPSMSADPVSTVAIRVSCPGTSTKDTVLNTFVSEPQ